MNTDTTPVYLVVIFSAFFVTTILFSFLINGLFLKFSKTLGIRDTDNTVIRWGSTSKPAFGGISFYILFLLSIACYSIFFSADEVLKNQQFIGFLTACTLGFIIGLADDAYNTKPLLKFLGQVACGVILIASGTYIDFFNTAILNYVLTLFWVVGLMNSINMLDNMDAITTSISISVILAALLMLVLNSNYSNVHFIILVGVLSSLLGFLFYNWNPSKMYMGDTGSQFLGVFLAAIAIVYFWNIKDGEGFRVQTKQLLIPALVFIMPIVDTTTVVINRIMRGQSPFVGGKDHTTHHLSYLGFTDRQVAWIFLDLSLLSLLFIIIIEAFIKNWDYVHFAIFTAYFLLVFGVLFGITKRKKHQDLNK